MVAPPPPMPADYPLPIAARLMRMWDLRVVWVVDGEAFHGTLTDSDIVVLAIASGCSPGELTAGECSDRDAERLEVDQLLTEAATILPHEPVRIPVVDDGRLVGAAWVADIERAVGLEPSRAGVHATS